MGKLLLRNQSEGTGLSDLYGLQGLSKGADRKWFLEAIESKLNKDKTALKSSVYSGKYRQYKDNCSKIKRRDTIRQFKEEANGIQTQAEEYQNAWRQRKETAE